MGILFRCTHSPAVRSILAAFCAIGGQHAFASMVVNGDFEGPSLPFSNGWALYSAGETFGGWKVESGNIDLVRWGNVGTDSIEANRTLGPESWIAASGSQSLDLNGYGPGSIYQDLSTTPNATYYLSFALAGNVVGGPLLVTMDFMWNSGVIDTLTFDVGAHNGFDMGWTYYQYAVTAPNDATVTRLRFASLSDTAARGPALDDVILSESPRPNIPIENLVVVPEPTTWIGGGLVALVGLIRSGNQGRVQGGGIQGTALRGAAGMRQFQPPSVTVPNAGPSTP